MPFCHWPNPIFSVSIRAGRDAGEREVIYEYLRVIGPWEEKELR
jgi:hypothetical protein